MRERANPWGMRLLSLAIALAVWFFAAVEKREQVAEKVIEAAVTYSPPRGFIILDPVQRVRVRLRGNTAKIRSLNPFMVDVLVQTTETERGSYDVHLDADNVVAPEGVEVVSIDPNVIPLRLDRELTQMLPVRARLVGEPAAGAVVQEVQVQPDKVLVSGPEARLRQVQALFTTPINLNGHALDFEETAAILTPDPLIKVVQPSVVTVRVPMQPPSPGQNVRPARGERP